MRAPSSMTYFAFVSYPYEWPFALLKRAAILHLDVHLRALDHGVTLTDASAYNVQFRGMRPVFIDIGLVSSVSRGGAVGRAPAILRAIPQSPVARSTFRHPASRVVSRPRPNGIPSSALAALWPARGWLFSAQSSCTYCCRPRAKRSAPKREGESDGRGSRPRPHA